jgi:hypothetical protein
LYPFWVPSAVPASVCSLALLNDGEVQVYTGRISALYTVAVPLFPPIPNGASWFKRRAPGYGVAVGTGVVTTEATGTGVGDGVAACGDVLVHPAQQISTAAITSRTSACFML